MLESLENNLIEVKNASSELTLHSFERRKECLEILSKKLIENSEKILAPHILGIFGSNLLVFCPK